MKLNGKTPGVFEELVILPRPDGDLYFVAKAVMDMSEFAKMCPPPKPPFRVMADKTEVSNPKDPTYQKDRARWMRLRTSYMFIESLSEGTPWMEWERVDRGDSSTWHLVEEELLGSGLSDNEIARLMYAMAKANGLSEQAVESARESFLAQMREAGETSYCQMVERINSQSGKPASAGESDLGTNLTNSPSTSKPISSPIIKLSSSEKNKPTTKPKEKRQEKREKSNA